MNNKKGYVLVIVLLIFAITTAAVIDFAGTVYGYVNTANNFAESERMSLLIKSVYLYTTEKTRDMSSRLSYNDQAELIFEEKIEDTKVGLRLEDNNSKFNVNRLVFQNGSVNETGYNMFKKLLRELKINEEYADRLVDYIDPDKITTVPGGENNAKNYYLFSLSELSYIFPEEVIKTVMPYLTVFGDADGKININTADLPLIKALHPEMSEALAKRIIEVREAKPFESLGDVVKVPGMERIGIEISDRIKVTSNSFNAVIKAERNDLVKTAVAGFDLSEGRVVTKYWREI